MVRSTLCALALLLSPSVILAQNGIAFVSDLAEHGNFDIYYMPDVDDPGTVVRLTTDVGIDNHPDIFWTGDPGTSKLVWSSSRDGDFELYIAPLLHAEDSSRKLTSNSIPDRHPHFSRDGDRIVFDAKCREVPVYDTVVNSECSVPVPKIRGSYRRFEALLVYTLSTGRLDTFDIADADIANQPRLWPDTTNAASLRTWVGHPSFSPDGKRILFSAAKDMDGSDWEVYSVAYDTLAHTISDLVQHTFSTNYPNSPNPIRMSAGAHYSHDGRSILYTSTRTPLGNSQLFRIPASARRVAVHPSNQLTFHNGNDYVPEEMDDGGIILTSDQGPSICDPEDKEGPSDDLDVVKVDQNGENRVDLTDAENNNGDEDRDEMELIADEVSWFCGAKPNLSDCTRIPRIWNICFFKFWFDIVNDSNGAHWNDSAYRGIRGKRHLYERAFREYASYMQSSDPATYSAMLQQMYLYGDFYCTYDWTLVPFWWVIPSNFGVYDSLVPLSPRLLVPRRDSSLNAGGATTFDWSDVPGEGTTYGIQVSMDPSFAATVIEQFDLAASTATTDKLRPDTVYYWRAGAVSQHGMTWSNVRRFSTGSSTVGVDAMMNAAQGEMWLPANYPNPFNGRTTMRFVLQRAGRVVLKVYDLFGREVSVVLDRTLDAGMHEVDWNTDGSPPGLYCYRIVVEATEPDSRTPFMASRTMVVVK